jgi:hypothetical protein
LFLLTAWLAAVVILCTNPSPLIASAAPEEESPAIVAEIAPLDQITGPVIETSVVGLYLQGQRHRERLRVPDLDVVFLEDGRRLLPLLRTLRTLGIETTDTGTAIIFRPEGATEAKVEYVSGRILLGSITRPVDLRVGISDITVRAEIYIPQDVLAEILGMDIRWNDQAYEFIFYTDQKLRVFEQFYKPGPSLLRTGDYVLPIELPGNLPPSEVSRFSAPEINFAEVRAQTRLAGSARYATGSNRLTAPSLRLWGQVFRGNLTGSVRQSQIGGNRSVTADHVSWTSWLDRTEITLGDGYFGVSELVFPSVNLFGARVNGILGSQRADRSAAMPRGGRNQTFQPSHVFEGYAPVGSEVTLFINGQEIDSQVPESLDSAPPGMGVYRFEGLNLLTRRMNDVRIVTEAPDGTVEETRRDVLRSNLLVPEGEFAYLGGVGTGRMFIGDRRTTEGFFAGGRLLHGVTPTLSVGFAGALQEQMLTTGIRRYTIYGQDLSWLPSRSVHVGSRLIWQPTGRVLVNGEAARSQDPSGRASGWACKMSAEYLRPRTSVRPGVFFYSPTFFEGRNAGLRDRAGGKLDVSVNLDGGNRLMIGGSHLRDNVYRQRPQTSSLSLAEIRWSSRGWIPNSALSLGFNQVWGGDERPRRLYSVGFDSGLIPGWDLRTNYLFGDDIRSSAGEEVLGGRQFGFYGGIGAGISRIELGRRLGSTWRMNLTHRESGNASRSFLDLSRSQIVGRSWQMRCFLGYDWYNELPFVDGRVEYNLDSSRRNRLMLDTRYHREEWSFNLRLHIRGLFGFVDRRPFLVRDAALTPESGGVKGKVFLDVNANGVPDAGEPGLEEIDIVTDAGHEISSGSRGQYIISGGNRARRVRVALEPETLPAIYTPTQAIQDAVFQPGIYTEVNLGVAAFGSISGRLAVPVGRKDSDGVWGVRILLVDEAGQLAGHSITSRDGYYYLGEVKPGTYTVKIDQETLPPGYELDVIAREVEVLSGTEPFDLEDVSFFGEYTGQPQEETPEPEEIEDEEIRYKVFD